MSMLISLLGFPCYLIATVVAFWSPMLSLEICGAVYHFIRTLPISSEVAARKAARKKVIARAQQVERESYKARMRKLRRLQASSDMR